MDGSSRRPPESARVSPVARIAAPLALLLAVVVVFAVVSGSTGEEGSGERQGRAEQPREGKNQKQKKPKQRTYVVEEGDSLSSIAARFGLTVEEIIALNEDVDPQALSTGQELKLK